MKMSSGLFFKRLIITNTLWAVGLRVLEITPNVLEMDLLSPMLTLYLILLNTEEKSLLNSETHGHLKHIVGSVVTKILVSGALLVGLSVMMLRTTVFSMSH